MLSNEVFKTEEDTKKLLNEKQELLDKMGENASVIAQLIEFKDNTLEQEYKSIKNAHKKMLELKASKEKLQAEKKKEIEILKQEMQNKEYQLACREATEKTLLEQRVTKEEYQVILETLHTLKTESEKLDSDDVNIADGLLQENDVLTHNADCSRVLSKYDFNHQNMKKLIKQEEELKVVTNAIEKLETVELASVTQLELEIKKNQVITKDSLNELQIEYKKFEKLYTSSMNTFSQKLSKVKEEIEEESQSIAKLISGYNKEVIKAEADMEKLKETFAREYVRISKVERRVLGRFEATLKRIQAANPSGC